MRVKNLKEVGNEFERIGFCIGENKNRIEVQALQDGLVAFFARVFGNSGGFDVDGVGLGSYSKSYFRKRLAKGKNNLQKNLVFDGNLRNSIQVGIKDDKNVYGFTDLDLEKIARFQEDQLNTDIFVANDEELEIVVKEIGEGILNVIQECFKKR